MNQQSVNQSRNSIVECIIIIGSLATVSCLYGFENPLLSIGVGLFFLVLAGSPVQINEWERAVLLRLGTYQKVLTPGITWTIPIIDSVQSRIDMRIRSTAFMAENTLTRDTVPVNVDAVLFWVVHDAKKAYLEVENFTETIAWAAQTTLRDIIGKAELVRMISDREELDRELLEVIDAKTSEWGITVQSVELRDVRIPEGLEDAMSRKAQADREREARIILAESEITVAEEMQRAAAIYEKNVVAYNLRAMNMTYEAVKEKGALMVIPSTMSHAMGSDILGTAAASFRLQKDALEG